MPGDEWQKFANLRLLLGWQWMHPGTKLLFMGGEFGQIREWNHNISLDWHLLHYPSHKGVLSWVKALNFTYKNEPALYELPFSPDGFKWIDTQDTQNSVLIFERKGASGESLIVACNFTPQVLSKYRLGVPKPGKWQEILNSDDQDFGGSGVLNSAHIKTQKIAFHTCEQSIELTLPPLGISVLKKVQK
jgi:1,4-alpha-glucan branching enzyme